MMTSGKLLIDWFNMYVMPRRRLQFRTLPDPLFGQSGQTAIFVFVLLLVGLTIGISVAGRTFRDLQSSGSSDFSARAFGAAEAGAEEALRQDLTGVTYGAYTNSTAVSPSFGSSNKSSFKYKVDQLYQLTQTVAEDDSVQLTTVNGSQFYDGTLKIYWGKISDTASGGENFNGTRPSLEVTLLTKGSGGDFGYAKFAVNAETKSPANNFTPPLDVTPILTHPINGLAANYSNMLANYATGQLDTNPAPNFSGAYTDLMLLNLKSADRVVYVRIKPLYNKATLGLESQNGTGTTAFPAQSYRVTSQGNSGDATRAVQVTKTLPALPPIFDFALFNGSSAQVGK